MALIDAQAIDALRLVPTDEPVKVRPAAGLDAIRLHDNLLAYYGAVVREALRVREIAVGNSTANVTLVDVVQVVARLLSARDAVLVDQIDITFDQDVHTAILLIERLGLSETLQGAGVYNLSLIQGLRLVDKLVRFFGADIAEGLGIEDVDFARLLAIADVTDGVGIDASVAPQLLLSVAARDDIGIAPADAVQMLFSPHMLEGVEIAAGYLEPNGSFTTWAMNTRSGAVTEYVDYTFNSFARLGRRYVGASASGLYDLSGDTDDGADIVARLKSGFLQFGGTQLSRLKEAYIAATGDGQFLLRITTKDGASYLYRSDARSGRNTKVHMGKGMQARYFAFELISTGQDFDLDTLEFVPLVKQRRV